MTSQRLGLRSTRSVLQLCLAVALALPAMQAYAVGLGTIEVKSRLDQPFVAEIPLTLNDPSEANDLVVRLASPEAFERVGLERSNEVSANLQFSVGRNTRGEPVIRVTTPQRMHDPYVSFLLEADWGKGKMVREYTALLDPPHTASVPRRAISAPVVSATPLAPAPVVTPPSAPEPAPTAAPSIAAGPPPPPEAQPAPAPPPINAASQPEPVPPPVAAAPPPEPQPNAAAPPPVSAAPQPEAPPPAAAPAPVAEAPPPAPAEPAPAPAAAPMPEQPAPAASATPDSVTVAKGDTLSQIAGKVRSNDVSVNRMMIALQRSNPDAFIHGNINLLKSGSVLRIPGGEQTQALTAEEANALVHEQVESWRQNGQPAPQLQADEGAETAVAKASKPAESTPAVAAAEKAPAVAPEAPPAAEPAPAKPTPSKPAAAPKPEATASAAHIRKPRGARLEIVPPVGNASHGSQSGASEGGSGSELRAQLAQTKEELAARNSEVNDLKSRVADLEKIQKDSQQLLTMKDSQLADMQQRLAELQKKAAAAPVPAASASAAPAPTSMVAAAPATNASVASASSVATATASASKPAPPAVKHPVAPATTEPVESLTPWYMQTYVLIGGVLVILAGILGLMLRRPQQAEPSPRSRNGALAASLATVRAAGADAKPDTPAARAKPATRATITDPLQPAMPPVTPPASKPYWTGPVAPVSVPPPPPAAAPVVAAAPAKPEAAPAAPAEDDWAIDETPEPEHAVPEVTKVRAAVPELDDPSQTVATKLELARAYIDIGDSDGARGMLEEVLIEGNGPQQEEAFKLLDTLDG
jgi:pilus assembly protein FimV